MRLMKSAVFLADVRCDGSAHDGCQRNCLIFWKEAWLKPVDEGGDGQDAAMPDPASRCERRPWSGSCNTLRDAREGTSASPPSCLPPRTPIAMEPDALCFRRSCTMS